MEFSISLARKYIGKRLVVSLRHVNPEGEDSFEGFWGVIVLVNENGMLLKIEGGRDDTYWLMPPTFEGFTPATMPFYQLDGCDEVVTEVDYESYFSMAPDPKHLRERKNGKDA